MGRDLEQKLTLDELLAKRDGKLLLWDITDNDLFWQLFTDTSQIPTGNVLKPRNKAEEKASKFYYSPYYRIVGHEDEMEKSRAVIDSFIADCRRVINLENDLLERGVKKRDRIRILQRESPRIPILNRDGPHAGGKTSQQIADEEYFEIKARPDPDKLDIGLPSYDFVVRRHNNYITLDKLVAPKGVEECTRFEAGERAKSRLLSGLKWVIGGGTSAIIGYAFYDWIVKYGAIAEQAGYDWITWVMANVIGALQPLAEIVFMITAPTLVYELTAHFKKNKKNHPKILIDGSGEPPHLIGTEVSPAMLVGAYDEYADKSPQDRFTQEPVLLKSLYKPLTIENLHELNNPSQSILAQVLEEKKVEVAGRADLSEFWFGLISVCTNTQWLNKLLESLKNRLNYATTIYVKNEVERTPRHERHLGVILADIIDGIKGRPAKRDAYLEFLDYTSRLADSSNELHISRRVIRLPKRAEELAAAEGSSYIEARHIMRAEAESRSQIQLAMLEKLSSALSEVGTPVNDSEKIGLVKVLCSYNDESLQNLEVGGPVGVYDYVYSEDYVGYAVPIRARIVGSKSAFSKLFSHNGIHIHTTNARVNQKVNEYSEALRGLFADDGIDIDDYKVLISIPTLDDDSTIVAGAYLAIKSAIEQKPLRQDLLMAAQLSDTIGDITSLPHMNSRLFYADGLCNGVVVSDYDYNNKIIKRDGSSLYRDINIIPVKNRKELFEAFVKAN
jgi:hypothetical protein